MPGPTFIRAFWFIVVSILVNQAYSLWLLISYDFDIGNLPYDYYLNSNMSGLLWYIIVTVIIMVDNDVQGIKNLSTLDLKWSSRASSWKQTLSYSAIVALSVIALSILLPGGTEIPTEQPFDIVVLSILSITVLAPICEEIWFRGYLYPAMLKQFKRPRERLTINAMIFSASHVFIVSFILGQGIPFYIFIVGFLLASLYERSRSIVPCIIVHAVNNTTVAVLELNGWTDPFGFYN